MTGDSCQVSHHMRHVTHDTRHIFFFLNIYVSYFFRCYYWHTSNTSGSPIRRIFIYTLFSKEFQPWFLFKIFFCLLAWFIGKSNNVPQISASDNTAYIYLVLSNIWGAVSNGDVLQKRGEKLNIYMFCLKILMYRCKYQTDTSVWINCILHFCKGKREWKWSPAHCLI